MFQEGRKERRKERKRKTERKEREEGNQVEKEEESEKASCQRWVNIEQLDWKDTVYKAIAGFLPGFTVIPESSPNIRFEDGAETVS